MDKKRRLQIRVLLFCVRLVGGIHLNEEHKNELDEIVKQLKDITDWSWDGWTGDKMICLKQVKRNELIREIIEELSDDDKIVYLTMYFNEYNYYDLLPLLGIMAINYKSITE